MLTLQNRQIAMHGQVAYYALTRKEAKLAYDLGQQLLCVYFSSHYQKCQQKIDILNRSTITFGLVQLGTANHTLLEATRVLRKAMTQQGRTPQGVTYFVQEAQFAEVDWSRLDITPDDEDAPPIPKVLQKDLPPFNPHRAAEFDYCQRDRLFTYADMVWSFVPVSEVPYLYRAGAQIYRIAMLGALPVLWRPAGRQRSGKAMDEEMITRMEKIDFVDDGPDVQYAVIVPEEKLRRATAALYAGATTEFHSVNIVMANQQVLASTLQVEEVRGGPLVPYVKIQATSLDGDWYNPLVPMLDYFAQRGCPFYFRSSCELGSEPHSDVHYLRPQAHTVDLYPGMKRQTGNKLVRQVDNAAGGLLINPGLGQEARHLYFQLLVLRELVYNHVQQVQQRQIAEIYIRLKPLDNNLWHVEDFSSCVTRRLSITTELQHQLIYNARKWCDFKVKAGKDFYFDYTKRITDLAQSPLE